MAAEAAEAAGLEVSTETDLGLSSSVAASAAVAVAASPGEVSVEVVQTGWKAGGVQSTATQMAEGTVAWVVVGLGESLAGQKPFSGSSSETLGG